MGHVEASKEKLVTDRRYRVIFWGPGHVGGTALREALQRPEFEVVGALVYSASKDGRDIGELAGLDPIGVAATTSVEQILATPADAVVHAPQPALDETEMVEQVCQLLRSGKNVISVTSFFYPPRRGADVEQKLQAACREGGTSLHGTGIHPSFMLERLAATLSGLLTDVRHIELTEVVDCAHMLAASPIAREIVGWGFEPARITPDTLGALIPDRMYQDSISYLGTLMFDAQPADIRIERDYRCITADARQQVGPLTIEAGHALTIIHHHEGWIGDHMFCTTEEYWYLGRSNHPFPQMNGESNYLIEITGSPADLRMQFDATSTMPDDIPVTTYITATPLLQAVIPVCKAAPGIVYHQPSPHWARDLRAVAAMPVTP